MISEFLKENNDTTVVLSEAEPWQYLVSQLSVSEVDAVLKHFDNKQRGNKHQKIERLRLEFVPATEEEKE